MKYFNHYIDLISEKEIELVLSFLNENNMMGKAVLYEDFENIDTEFVLKILARKSFILNQLIDKITAKQ